MKTKEPFDIFIIGGGINGCGIARDAAGRGYSVGLAEKGDLAGATSSGSTKLIHGGLRYLEYYEFQLVRKALIEREVLWGIAPHLIRPLRFVLPHHEGLRPNWLIRLGLFLYDHLGGRKLLPGTRSINFSGDIVGKPIKPLFKKGFEYSDCWVDDARLVVLNARDAANRGAVIRTNTEVVDVLRSDGHWTIQTKDHAGVEQSFQAKALVNAAGPWADKIHAKGSNHNSADNIRLVRGSHIVVPKLYDHDRCYIFQNADGRIVFAIPYEDDFTLIGTTDCDHDNNPDNVEITDKEIDYLCESVSSYFLKGTCPTDVVWTYSAVRPLFSDGKSDAKATTRDYHLKVELDNGQTPLISIFGGKITTYRKLSEDVLSKVEAHLSPRKPPWTAIVALPGGEFTVGGFEKKVSDLRNEYPFLDEKHTRRLVRLYGKLANQILGNATNYEDLGRCFGADLYEIEVTYQIENEWARCAADILWRRTKLGLRVSSKEAEELDLYLTSIV